MSQLTPAAQAAAQAVLDRIAARLLAAGSKSTHS
jgi:hypothetical protein